MHEWQRYNAYCKPKLAELLLALKLDKNFKRAEGNYLYTEDGTQVLDLIGGFGAAMIGHNHPELKQVFIEALNNNLPMNAQVSVRAEAACLAERLNELVPGETGYYVNLSNSGTESMEVAIKHAYKVHFDKVRRKYEMFTRILNDLYYRIEREQLAVELPGGKTELSKFRDDLDEYNLTQFENFQNHPVLIALKGSFHGKTVSSLKVTFNKSYREAFEGLSSIQPVFIDMEQPEHLSEAVHEHHSLFYYPILEDKRVVLRPVRLTRAIAFVLEIIQGEGGIRVVQNKTLETLASLHTELKLPYIIDEIQTGCGRTGSVFAYTKTPLHRIEPEYITLSKALGGNLVKIGATLIKKSVYDEDFGILHTSTFGEDEISSRVAFQFLNIITRQNGQFLKDVANKGNYLLERLRELQSRYPGIVRDVRGLGLMLGVELTPLNDYAPFFRAAGKQGVLSLLIASYLLEYHHIRILAPLTTMLKGNPGKVRLSMLRIQPPGTITNVEIDRFIKALDEVLNIIMCNNEYCLVGHLSGQQVSEENRKNPLSMSVTWKVNDSTTDKHIDARTCFVVHPTQLEHLMEYYFPSFARYRWDRVTMERWWHRISRFLEPIYAMSSYITSQDFVVENNLVFVPYLPKYLVEAKSGIKLQEVQDKIQDAVIVGKELGDDNIPTAMVGLGAYTSIVTNNGQTINDYEVPITTGNAYTAALVLLGIDHAAREQGIDIATAKVAVVGATGNIGLVLAKVLIQQAGQLHLIGRPGESGLFRLRYARQQCLQEFLALIHQESVANVDFHEMAPGMIARKVYQALKTKRAKDDEAVAALFAGLDAEKLPTDMGTVLEKVLADEQFDDGESYGVELHTDMAILRSCDIVVVATNSPDPHLITPEKVRPGSIVCCASVPSNLSPAFEEQLDHFYAFEGGLARLPEKSRIDFVGMPGADICYGCIGETLLTGFDGYNHSFCKGLLEVEHIYQTLEMAIQHGFSLGDFKLNDKVWKQVTSVHE